MSLIRRPRQRPLHLSPGDRWSLLRYSLGGILLGALLLLPLRWWLLEQPAGGLAWNMLWGGLVVLPLAQLVRGLPQEAAPRIDLVPEQGFAPLRPLSLRINRLLEQLNSLAVARESLLRGLVHDLCGPLTRLILRVEQLRLESEVDPAMIDGLHGDLDALRNLSDQLAAIPDDEPLEDRAEVLALDDLCHRIADSYGHGRVLIRTPRLIVRLDRGSLQRTLHNLIDNALEYGQPPLQISAQLARQGLSILVEDHGHGICSSELLSMVHLPRADDRQESQHRGLGQSSLGGLAAELHLPLAVLVSSTDRRRFSRVPAPAQLPGPRSAK